MGYKILVCGGNGAGKSTLAKELSAQSGYKFVDTEEYYFPKTEDGYAYSDARTGEEVAALLLRDLQEYDDFIFASVMANFGEEVRSQFTHVVFVDVPKPLRLERVKNRSYQKFGSRMRPGGGLFEKEQSFFKMVESRPENQVEEWLATLSLPIVNALENRQSRIPSGRLCRPVQKNQGGLLDRVNYIIRVDGTRPPAENAKAILQKLRKL